MKERLKAFFQKPLFIAVVAIIVIFAGIGWRKYTLLTDTQTKKKGSLWKDISTPSPEKKIKEKIDIYQQLLAEEAQGPKSELAKRAAENPRRKYKKSEIEKKKMTGHVVLPVKKRQDQMELTTQEKNKKKLTFINNLDIREKERYAAVFKGTQEIRQGSYVQIVLEDEIEFGGFKLRQGAILNALPSLVGERIHLHITSAKAVDELIDMRKYGLVCLEDPTLVEGIYHSQVAKMVSDAAKKSARSKAWDLLPEDASTLRDVGQEVLSIADISETITISGKLFIAFPEKEIVK
jgi:hypothetical protein